MITTFKSKIVKGNNRGAGFIRVPIEIRPQFKKNDQFKVAVVIKAKTIEFFGKVKDKHGEGFYIPTNLADEYNLIHQIAEVRVKKIGGFHTKIGNEGRLYIPSVMGNKLNLRKGDIISIHYQADGKNIIKYCIVKKREDTTKQNEYLALVGSENVGLRGNFKINTIFKNKERIKLSHLMSSLLRRFNYSPISEEETVAFYGNRIPIIINNKIKLSEIAYYLGAYFADGTKKGNSWAISASTFRQARYFLEMHSNIIKDSQIKFNLTYTNNLDDDNLRWRLTDSWKKKAGLNIDHNKIRIIKSQVKFAQNRNPFGSLTIKENRQLTLICYNGLLQHLFKKILLNKDKVLALDFVCGVLEGDGSPSAKKRGHIHIATNKKELKILKEIFSIAQLRCKGYMEKQNKATLRIGSLEILKNLPLLYQKLFKYYPKRRKKLIKRLLGTGAAKFIKGEQKSTSGWIKSYLKKEKVLDDKYNLTKKGKLIKSCLSKMAKELKDD